MSSLAEKYSNCHMRVICIPDGYAHHAGSRTQEQGVPGVTIETLNQEQVLKTSMIFLANSGVSCTSLADLRLTESLHVPYTLDTHKAQYILVTGHTSATFRTVMQGRFGN